MPTTRNIRIPRPAVAALGLALLAGCATATVPVQQAAHHHGAAPPAAAQAPAAAPASRAASMEQLTALLGCPPRKLQVDAAELRQAACDSPQGRLTIVTFATDSGKRTWLDAAQAYGGSYLVGERWVVVAAAGPLERLRARLGGELEIPQHH
ncbi:hypothetical protein ACFFV7_00035 [Nonomuraea spiralis]|uniref:Lipoprotein n=1 Tax=Nonomuraea spiralis TaxID=46182 RepID=A0ABV5I550_9ACTN|nr:hypothetical protein [Nonomuraea spiralis]GGS62174.1 hypothetical protein GCM10010176_000070 [Nonomuraea spiralis]